MLNCYVTKQRGQIYTIIAPTGQICNVECECFFHIVYAQSLIRWANWSLCLSYLRFERSSSIPTIHPLRYQFCLVLWPRIQSIDSQLTNQKQGDSHFLIDWGKQFFCVTFSFNFQFLNHHRINNFLPNSWQY
jgi:hypothetical protein